MEGSKNGSELGNYFGTPGKSLLMNVGMSAVLGL